MIKKIENDHELHCILKDYMYKYNIDMVTIPPGEYRCLEIFSMYRSDLKIKLFCSSCNINNNFLRFSYSSSNNPIIITFKCSNEFEPKKLMEIFETIDMKQPVRYIVDRMMEMFIPRDRYMELKYNLK